MDAMARRGRDVMTERAVRGKILAVDDSPLMREMLVAQLESAGFSARTVASGGCALSVLAREHFDVVILDVQMPYMDGVDVGIALRADPSTAGVSIAMHTTLAEADVRRRFSGYDVFLHKPCDPRQLGHMMDDLVRAQRARDPDERST